MGIVSFRQRATYTLLLFVLLLVLVPGGGHEGDLNFWRHWATYIFEHGLGNVYQLEDNNYNPLYHYILWLYGWLLGDLEKVNYYLHALKAFTLVFDFAGAFWAASLVPERDRRFGLALLLLLNIGYLYNTLLWIQVDSIYSFFCFGAVVLAARRRPVSSMLCYVLAIAAKTQAIIFLPPLLLLWAPQWWRRPWQLAQGLGAGAGLAVLLLAPFTWWSWENYLPRIIDLNLHAVGMYPYVSMSAYNFWYFLLPGDVALTTIDSQPLAGLTYHSWGLLLFCAFSALALAPLLVAAWQWRRPAGPQPNLALVLLSCGVVPLLFTFFNTQMHERYWHPALLFVAAYGFVRRDYLPFALLSVAYFLNLESVLHYLRLLKYGVALFHPQLIAGLFALVIVLALVKIYRLAPWRGAAPSAPSPPRPAAAYTLG